jgi:hypothetical protein
MPLIPQQDIVVIRGPYQVAPGQGTEDVAAQKLKLALESYPPCRIVSINGGGNLHAYVLTAIVETI